MNLVVIFAGGVGNRMHTKETPKQFLEAHGKTIIERTIEAFERHEEIDAIVVVCNAEWVERCKGLLKRAGIKKVVAVVPGGETGQLSIFNGLVAAREYVGVRKTTVLIHDGVRPLVDRETISACIAAVREYGSAITCVHAKETILTIEDDGSGCVRDVVDRNACMLARAPQCFELNALLSEHEWALANGRTDYIDSATLMMERGHTLHVIEGKNENIKVTTHDDYYALQATLNARENQQLAEVRHE